MTVTFVVALYDKKGNLENVSAVTKALQPGETERLTGGFVIPGDNSGYYAEVFLTDSLTELNPISNVIKIQQK